MVMSSNNDQMSRCILIRQAAANMLLRHYNICHNVVVVINVCLDECIRHAFQRNTSCFLVVEVNFRLPALHHNTLSYKDFIRT